MNFIASLRKTADDASRLVFSCTNLSDHDRAALVIAAEHAWAQFAAAGGYNVRVRDRRVEVEYWPASRVASTAS
jgi:hypothetical protein